MRIEGVPFTVTKWDAVAAEEHKGETGASCWQKSEAGNLRVRMVRYSPGFRADHYCPRGHVLLILEGELAILLKNGSKHNLSAGMSFQVGDDENNPHLVYSKAGAVAFVVD